MLLIIAPVWGGEGRQLCLECHSVHHIENGRCPDCHRGNPASGRKNIAHSGLIAGKYVRYTLGTTTYLKNASSLIDQYACRRCHVINGSGNKLAVSLDAAAQQKNGEELVNSIRQPVDSMPRFRLNEEQGILLVNAIYAGARRKHNESGASVVVHFDTPKNMNPDVFTRLCGSCHRMLSERRGTLGTGDIGPNISGLLSSHYPKTFRGKDAWTVKGLTSWLNNPREVQRWARMRPVNLSNDELMELVSILQVTY